MFNLQYLRLASRMRLSPSKARPAEFSNVKFSVHPSHYQLRAVLKEQAVQPVLADLLGLIDTETLFVDVGANVGVFSLLVAGCSGANVISFEPVRSTFHSFILNCGLNPGLSVFPMNVAVGQFSSSTLVTAVRNSGINQIVTVAEREGEPLQWTPMVNLSDFGVEKMMQNHKKLVIKIDVERYELEVLRGAQNLLKSKFPIAICVEAPLDIRAAVEAILGVEYRPFRPNRSPILPVQRETHSIDVFYGNEEWFR